MRYPCGWRQNPFLMNEKIKYKKSFLSADAFHFIMNPNGHLFLVTKLFSVAALYVLCGLNRFILLGNYCKSCVCHI